MPSFLVVEVSIKTYSEEEMVPKNIPYDYNQKKVLLREVSRYIRDHKVSSLIDIGAGDGALAIPLARKVKKYVAVEENGKNVQKLKKAGLTVIKGCFPVPVSGKYDLALVSHSIPETTELYKNFLYTVWTLLKKKGVLLVVTFKGADDELASLKKELQPGFVDADQEKFREMMSILSSFSVPAIRRVASTITSQKSKNLTELLSFLIGRTKKEREELYPKLERIVHLRYKTTQGYSFRTHHLFIFAQKQ